MAINPTPRPLNCGNQWRHTGRAGPPSATAVVRSGDHIGLAPRCPQCIRQLDAAPAKGILVDVYELGAALQRRPDDLDPALD